LNLFRISDFRFRIFCTEAGLRLQSTPRRPRELPVTMTLRNTNNIPDWDLFLHRS
jgi:hypothetical protein